MEVRFLLNGLSARRPSTRSVRPWLFVLLTLLMSSAIITPPAQAQTAPAVLFIGFSPTLPPGDSLAFRLAVAHAIDRSAAAAAAAGALRSPQGVQPASNIQHSSLPGHNPSVRGHTLDPARAKELYRQSGWTSSISILTSSSPAPWARAVEEVITANLRNALGATVSYARVASFSVLTSSAGSGIVPAWKYGWSANPKDFGYPSMALGIAREYFMSDPEIRRLVETGAGQAVEQMLLDKGLIIPIIFYITQL